MRAIITASGAAVLATALFAASGMGQVTCPAKVTHSGTSGIDVFTAETSARMTGQGNEDFLTGSPESDCLNGGSGPDSLDGDAGNDLLAGEAGEDQIFGGLGNDIINGGSNDDLLLADEGDDTISGEGGNDIIFGYVGIDTTNAGSGDDIIEIIAGDVPAGATEKIDGGGGIDTAQIDFAHGPVQPPSFTIVDPETGGKYVFKSVERVEDRPGN